MPTIGWFEILLVVAVAIIVIGPKDFPFMLKKVGSWIGTTKRYISTIQSEVADLDIGSNEIEKRRKKRYSRRHQRRAIHFFIKFSKQNDSNELRSRLILFSFFNFISFKKMLVVSAYTFRFSPYKNEFLRIFCAFWNFSKFNV